MGEGIYSKVMEIATRRGFIWPSSEIYGGVSGFYDHAPLGKLIARHIQDKIREYYLFGENFLEIESSTICPQDVFVASGHIDSFGDRMAECTKCGEPYRVDNLITEQAGIDTDGMGISELEGLLKKHKISCPKCKSYLGEIWDFNLMFRTEIGPGKNKIVGYIRPETAQGIFTNFKRLFEYNRRKLPLGVLQIGKSYRNEISPRQGMIRLREFNQAEVEVFVSPDQKSSHPNFKAFSKMKVPLLTRKEQSKKAGKPVSMTLADAVTRKIIAHEFLAYYIGLSVKLFKELGIPIKSLRCRQHLESELAHYAIDVWDVEIETGFGWVEVVGIADRTDYDLSQHQAISKEKMEVSWDSKKFIPHVIEPSYGIDRLVYCVLEKAYHEDKRGWPIFRFAPSVAPYQIAVYALVNKEGMDKKSEEIAQALRRAGFHVILDNSGSIGRRYARADEIGTPYCITVDGDTLKDKTVTLRDRDSRKQVRIPVEKAKDILDGLISGETSFSSTGKPL